MNTALFIDDERFPPQDGRDWHVVRSVPEAVHWVKTHGVPAYVSFDNDLKRRGEGRHFAQWLVRRDMEEEGRFIPPGFSFYVHSQNSVNGIEATLGHYLARRHSLLRDLQNRPRAW